MDGVQQVCEVWKRPGYHMACRWTLGRVFSLLVERCRGGPGVSEEGRAAASRRETNAPGLCLATYYQQGPKCPDYGAWLGVLTNNLSGPGPCRGATGQWQKGGLY